MQSLTENGLQLLLARYLKEGESTFEDLAERVTLHADPKGGAKYKLYKEAILSLKFLPSRMPYMGTERPFSSSCFVLGPIEDSRESIFQVLVDMAEVQAFGGGTGYDFSLLRPQGAPIQSNRGKASGPISFMRLYNEVTQVILRAGNKAGAQMGILRIDHPDIEAFIDMKDQETDMMNFNISVAVTDRFMELAIKDWETEPNFDLVHEGKVYKTVNAHQLYLKLCKHAWGNGEPGIIFIDTMNKYNNFPVPITATNACSEQPMPGYTSCNLGSVNVSEFASKDGFDFNGFSESVLTGIYFLNDSMNHAWWPVEKIKQNTLKYRNIGLGIMGFADALIKMRIPYDSDEAILFARKLARKLQANAEEASTLYAREHGTTPNTTLTTVAPTGSISMLANTSPSIEPLFGLTYMRNTVMGSMRVVSPLFEEYLVDEGLWSPEIIEYVSKNGDLSGIEHQDIQHTAEMVELFKTANNIPWKTHIAIQAAFQNEIDSAVSKTVNLPEDATVIDVTKVFYNAWLHECKSVTIYRNNSRTVQAIVKGSESKTSLADLGVVMDIPQGNPAECTTCTL